MKCIAPSQNVKILGRAIHSLAKIGDELYIEPKNDVLTFCTLSVSKNAMAEFNMSTSFFSSYIFEPDVEEIKCKVAMKSCLNVFRTSHHFDKNVESCEMRLKPSGNVVIFFIKFSNCTTRKYFLPIIDSEKFEVTYEKNELNKFVCSSKLLASSMKNFRASEGEITINVSRNKMTLKNHLELRRDKSLMRTEVAFEPTEFDCYLAGSEGAVTFCLKEFRSAIGFAEPANLSVTLLLSTAGMPLKVQVANQPAFEMSYILATRVPSQLEADSSMHHSSSSAAASEPQRQGSTPSATISQRRNTPLTSDRNQSQRLSNNPFLTASDRTPIASRRSSQEQQQRASNEASRRLSQEQQQRALNEAELDEMVPGSPENPADLGSFSKIPSQRMFSTSFNGPAGIVLDTPDDYVPPCPEQDSEHRTTCDPNLAPEVANIVKIVFSRCFQPTHKPSFSPIILAGQSDSE